MEGMFKKYVLRNCKLQKKTRKKVFGVKMCKIKNIVTKILHRTYLLLFFAQNCFRVDKSDIGFCSFKKV